MEYQRAVRFVVMGVVGKVSKKNLIEWQGRRFHLEDCSIQSAVRQAIHKVRNGDIRQPSLKTKS